MSTDITLALLIIGGLLLLAALLTSVLKLLPGPVRVLAALCGVGLLAWGLTQQFMARPPARAASSTTAPATAPAQAKTNAPPARADLTLVASSAFADCSHPSDPATPPDGTNASRTQMLAAQQALKVYDAATTTYTHCVDAAAQNIVEQYQDFVPAAELRAVRALDVKVHNDAVDHDQQLVNRFNQQLRVFLAKQPSKSPLPAP